MGSWNEQTLGELLLWSAIVIARTSIKANVDFACIVVTETHESLRPAEISLVHVGSRGAASMCNPLRMHELSLTLGALKIRIGFWGIFYYNHNKEPPK